MKKHAGFSLLEVVAAAALIGVIMTFMAPSIKGAFDKVADNKLRNDLTAVGQAVQIYKVEKKSYPTTIQQLFDEKYVNNNVVNGPNDTEIKINTDGTVTGTLSNGKKLTYDGYRLVEEGSTTPEQSQS